MMHVIVGRTIGNDKIIKRLREQGEVDIIVIDDEHEGPPMYDGDVVIYSSKQAEAFLKDNKDVKFHSYKCRHPLMNIEHYEF
ncbi:MULTISPECIES: hypothetical protein [Sporosarcina]|uniref:Uncharacterized protein n=1 Tax=Sporosarcina contaminans TaxID=633403 RepID=A0ABW3TXC4_9BACL